MINLLEYIVPASICFLPGASGNDTLRDLVFHCLREDDAETRRRAWQDILAKSRSPTPQTVNLGQGFALVHSRLARLARIRVALGLLPASRKLLKGEPVHTLLGIAIPQHQSRVYLSLLARLNRMLERADAGRVFARAGSLGAGESARDRDAATAMIMDFIRTFEKG